MDTVSVVFLIAFTAGCMAICFMLALSASSAPKWEPEPDEAPEPEEDADQVLVAVGGDVYALDDADVDFLREAAGGLP